MEHLFFWHALYVLNSAKTSIAIAKPLIIPLVQFSNGCHNCNHILMVIVNMDIGYRANLFLLFKG